MLRSHWLFTLVERRLLAGVCGNDQLVCFLWNCCGVSRNNKVKHSCLSFQLWIIVQEFIATLFNDSLHSYPRVLHILCNAKYIDDTII